jgi:hypothetical protein
MILSRLERTAKGQNPRKVNSRRRPARNALAASGLQKRDRTTGENPGYCVCDSAWVGDEKKPDGGRVRVWRPSPCRRPLINHPWRAAMHASDTTSLVRFLPAQTGNGVLTMSSVDAAQAS